MSKICKALSLFFMGICCSSSMPNPTVYITSFNIVEDDVNNQIILSGRYTSNEDTTLGGMFLYNQIVDGIGDNVCSSNFTNFNKGENLDTGPDESYRVIPYLELPTYQDKYELQIVFMNQVDSKFEDIRLEYRRYVNPIVYFTEKDNNVGVTSGYLRQGYDINKGIIDYEDKIMFTNFEDSIVEEVYHHFDISCFDVYYFNGADNYFKGNIYLEWVDNYFLFEDIPLYEGTNIRRIELELKNNKLKFKNDLYFDPITHNPSTELIDGYKQTPYLFLPKDNYEELKRISFRITFDCQGANLKPFSVIGMFEVSFAKKFMGDCSDSEYCVLTSEDLGDNVREKVVDVTL